VSQFIILLRGINVGGHNKLPMTDLREILEGLGYESVKTYIQSGNVVLFAAAPPDNAAITAAIEKRCGFAPRVFTISAERFRAIADANPYEEEVVDPKHLHISFLSGPAAADVDAMQACKGPTEEFTLTSDALYLHAPDGIGRSKFAAAAEKLLGVEATGRNLNTVRKLLGMLDA
jgi:uncharacterized protein (DUF1697 family)